MNVDFIRFKSYTLININLKTNFKEQKHNYILKFGRVSGVELQSLFSATKYFWTNPKFLRKAIVERADSDSHVGWGR